MLLCCCLTAMKYNYGNVETVRPGPTKRLTYPKYLITRLLKSTQGREWPTEDFMINHDQSQ